MPTDQEREAWGDALQRAVNRCYELGCPCAFPRLRQFLEFDFADHGSAPFACHETETLIRLVFHARDDDWSKDESDSELLTCAHCGSRVQLDWEDYSIHMDRSTSTWLDPGPEPIGAPAESTMPVRAGLRTLARHGAGPAGSLFRESTTEELESWLDAAIS